MGNKAIMNEFSAPQLRLCPLGNKDKAEALYKGISTYNFNSIDNALIRNDVVNRKPAM
jgi:hypothetical protein